MVDMARKRKKTTKTTKKKVKKQKEKVKNLNRKIGRIVQSKGRKYRVKKVKVGKTVKKYRQVWNVKNPIRDYKRKSAKEPGRRKSKSGRIYYEYRANRSDVPPTRI